jgi:hypothetical protein
VELSPELQKWLLDGTDPSVRYRVLRELLDRPEDDPEVAAARKEIGVKGWAAELLSRQLPEGQWFTPGTSARELYRPEYVSTNWCMVVLSDLGATRSDPRVARAAELMLDRYSSAEFDELGGKDSELCCTGNDVRIMTRFGYGEDPRVLRALEWLVSAQKPDGGWHCFPSEAGTLDAWEALAAFAALPNERRTPGIRRAIDRGMEFYLDRELLYENGATYAPWLRLHYPVHYFYDVLVGLDVATALGRGSDPRLGKALNWLEQRRNRDGSWKLEALHPDVEDAEYLEGMRTPYFALGLEFPGCPSRWITTTALAVLRRAGRL